MEEAINSPRTLDESRTGGRGRSMACATAVAAILIGMLLVTSPATATSPPMKSSKTLKSPYSGEAAVFGFLGSNGCDATISMPVTPWFNQTNGRAVMSLNVSEKSCGLANSSAGIEAGAGIDLNSTFTASSTGSFKVSVTWSFDYQVYLSAKETKKSELSYAYVEVGAGATLVNQTGSGVGTIGDNYSSFENTTKAALHTYKYTVTYSGRLKLTKGALYYVSTEVDADLEVGVGLRGGSATASLDMGTPTYKAVLTAVVQP
jgi:hypothetical protein